MRLCYTCDREERYAWAVGEEEKQQTETASRDHCTKCANCETTVKDDAKGRGKRILLIEVPEEEEKFFFLCEGFRCQNKVRSLQLGIAAY